MFYIIEKFSNGIVIKREIDGHEECDHRLMTQAEINTIDQDFVKDSKAKSLFMDKIPFDFDKPMK